MPPLYRTNVTGRPTLFRQPAATRSHNVPMMGAFGATLSMFGPLHFQRGKHAPSAHHDERVRLTGRENHMNQACVRNDTIDVGNHHGRPQYRSVPAISDIAGTQRHLAVAGHCFSSGGRHHAWPGTRRSGRQSVRRCSPCTAYAIGGNCASQPTGTCQCSSYRWPA